MNLILNISGFLLIKFPQLNTYLLNYNNNSLRIVYFHMVTEKHHDYYFKNKAISPNSFCKQIRFIKNNFDIISMEQALYHAENGYSLKNKMVITFDDGFKENFTIIAPILMEERIPATFFLINQCIDNNDLMWRNKLIVIQKCRSNKLNDILIKLQTKYNLGPMKNNDSLLTWSFRAWPMIYKDNIVNDLWKMIDIGPIKDYLINHKPYMSIKEINELIQNKFEIGSHSLTHPNFSKLSFNEYSVEILKSVENLEKLFNIKINSFSYPFGIRPKNNFENIFLSKNNIEVKTFLGSKNNLNNYINSIAWDRDNLEYKYSLMMFRLSLLPILRKHRLVK